MLKVDLTEDVRISYEILDRLADAYRRMRNTCCGIGSWGSWAASV